jgi:hypothetical protein
MARQSERLARDHDRERQRGDQGQGQPEQAEALATRKQILDQLGHAEPGREQNQPADGAPEHRAPAEFALYGDERRIDWNRQQRGI